MNLTHIPVLLEETMHLLLGGHRKLFVDGTLGQGGHAEQILERDSATQVLGIDRDRGALQVAEKRLARFGERVHLFRGDYSMMSEFVDELGWQGVDGILLDIGFGSHQLDDAARGFSLSNDGPLDMRMDQSVGVTASTILNQYSEEEIAAIFYKYGEVRASRKVARAVVERREVRPWLRTGEFAELVNRVLHRPGPPARRPLATQCFQALRIAVNNELAELESALAMAPKLLNKEGRIAVISFHSLEDRMVKENFRDETVNCICPKDFPICSCSKRARYKVLTRKPIIASEQELEVNRRAGSAKLRVAERV